MYRLDADTTARCGVELTLTPAYDAVKLQFALVHTPPLIATAASTQYIPLPMTPLSENGPEKSDSTITGPKPTSYVASDTRTFLAITMPEARLAFTYRAVTLFSSSFDVESSPTTEMFASGHTSPPMPSTNEHGGVEQKLQGAAPREEHNLLVAECARADQHGALIDCGAPLSCAGAARDDPYVAVADTNGLNRWKDWRVVTVRVVALHQPSNCKVHQQSANKHEQERDADSKHRIPWRILVCLGFPELGLECTRRGTWEVQFAVNEYVAQKLIFRYLCATVWASFRVYPSSHLLRL